MKTKKSSKQQGWAARKLRGTKDWFWTHRYRLRKIFLIGLAVWLVFYAQVWLVSNWYINKHHKEPLTFGVTFIPEYVRYFGLDSHQTLLAFRDDMGIKRFRLVSFWNEIEPHPGQYDFSELDWEMDAVQAVGGQMSLSIGLRQPRWPECHQPDWAVDLSVQQRNDSVNNFLRAVVNHVKSRAGLKDYQLENEYFLSVFGICPYPERQQLISEFKLVKSLDPKRPIIMSLANNYFGIPTGQPRADQFGVSVYKRVWDQTVTHRYFEYPFSPRYYAWRAGLTEMFTGKSSMLHELQAEPWPPKGVGLKDASIAEQNKSMDAPRLKARVQYAIDTGFRDIDFWGAEWWYWRKEVKHDPSLWNVIKDELRRVQATHP